MRNGKIRKLVENFFSSPPLTVPKWSFSKKWKSFVSKEIEKVKEEYSEKELVKKIGLIHTNAFEKLLNDLTKDFKNEWKNIDPKDVEDVVMTACEKFSIYRDSYDPEKGKDEYQHLHWRINYDLINKSNQKKANSIDETKKHPYNDNGGDDAGVIELRNYLSELYHNCDTSLPRVLGHLLAAKQIEIDSLSELGIRHIFPSRGFLLKDVPEEFSFLRDIEDFRSDVLGYSKYERIVESQERQFMLLAIELLKECRVKFDKQLDEMVKIANENGQHIIKQELKERYPILSAVAVDKNGKTIMTAFKGETGCIDKQHCEYTLFEDLFSDIDKERMRGGTLYVTLEPCNRRGLNKIPCAVRCVEAGIAKIYIGTHDPDKNVKWQGATTIQTGKYSFKVDSEGNPVIENNEKEKVKKIEAAKALMKIFDDKLYPQSCENGIKIYTIGNPVNKDNIRLFHPDLTLEIIKLNKVFLKSKEKNAFVFFDMSSF